MQRISPERSQAVFPVVLPVPLVPVPPNLVFDLSEPRDHPPTELPFVAAKREGHRPRGSAQGNASFVSVITESPEKECEGITGLHLLMPMFPSIEWSLGEGGIPLVLIYYHG